jgi:hypothetical protein
MEFRASGEGGRRAPMRKGSVTEDAIVDCFEVVSTNREESGHERVNRKESLGLPG